MKRRLVGVFQLFAKTEAAIAFLLGLIIIAGWLFNIKELTSLVPASDQMNPFSALSSILAAMSLLCLLTSGNKLKYVSRLLAFFITLIGVSRLVDSFTGFDIDISH